MRAHVRSCGACRTFSTSLAQRPGDLAALAPGLPATAGAALLAHLLPGAKAGLASSAGTAAAGAGGGMAATVATKVAIVAVATAALAGTGTVGRDAVTAPYHSARPAVAAPSAPHVRPTSAPASAPARLVSATASRVTGPAHAEHGRSHAAADRRPAETSRDPAKSQAMPAHGPLAAHANHERRGANGQAPAQAKRQTAFSHGRRPEAKAVSHPSVSAKTPPPAATVGPRPAHPGRPAVAAAPATQAKPAKPATPAGAQGLPAAAVTTPPSTTPPGTSGAAHAAK
jgi:hypothetical protein